MMDNRLLTEILNKHEIKELFYSFHKNGGDLEYCTNEAIRLAMACNLAKMSEVVEGIENPYAFVNGEPIPRWEKERQAFDKALERVLEAIKGE